MKGQDRIIDMRKAGRAPSVGVYLSMSEHRPWFDWQDMQTPGFNTVWIEDHDKPESLDLRFLVGLRVCIGAEEGKPWQGLVDACLKARASEVAVTGMQDGQVAVLWHSKEQHADHS